MSKQLIYSEHFTVYQYVSSKVFHTVGLEHCNSCYQLAALLPGVLQPLQELMWQDEAELLMCQALSGLLLLQYSVLTNHNKV